MPTATALLSVSVCIYCLSSDTITFEINTPDPRSPGDHLGRGPKCKWVLTAQGVLDIPRSLNLSWARVCLSCLSVWLLPTCLCAGRPCSFGSAACAAVVCPRDLPCLVFSSRQPHTLSLSLSRSQLPLPTLNIPQLSHLLFCLDFVRPLPSEVLWLTTQKTRTAQAPISVGSRVYCTQPPPNQTRPRHLPHAIDARPPH